MPSKNSFTGPCLTLTSATKHKPPNSRWMAYVSYALLGRGRGEPPARAISMRFLRSTS